MKRILFIILILTAGIVSRSQIYELYAIRQNTTDFLNTGFIYGGIDNSVNDSYSITIPNPTLDSFYVQVGTSDVFNKNGVFVMKTIEYGRQFYGYDYPQAAGQFVKSADGIYRNFTVPAKDVSYSIGMMVMFRAGINNTGTASLNINGLGAKTIVKRQNTVLANNDILTNMICLLVYDGTNFILINPVVN